MPKYRCTLIDGDRLESGFVTADTHEAAAMAWAKQCEPIRADFAMVAVKGKNAKGLNQGKAFDRFVRASELAPMWRPKGEACKVMCATCPFGPGGHQLNDAAQALEAAQQVAKLGLDFHCHSTVYTDVLKPGQTPRQKARALWKVCAGAIAYKHALELTKRREILTEQGRLIDDTPTP